MKKTVFLHNDEYYYEVIRKNIKKYRLEHKLTQQDLADLTGLSRQYICNIENESRNKHLTISVLGRISDALNIQIANFFLEESSNKKQETIKSLVTN